MQKQPRIVDKKVDDFQLTTADFLGKPKMNGHGERNMPDDIVFGCPSVTFHQDGVEKLIQGQYSAEEQQPDPDLGKSLRVGWRNLAPPDKVNHPFVFPSCLPEYCAFFIWILAEKSAPICDAEIQREAKGPRHPKQHGAI